MEGDSFGLGFPITNWIHHGEIMIIQQIEEYFEKQNWQYSIQKDETDNSYLSTSYHEIGDTIFSLFLEIYPDNHSVKLYLYAPNHVPEDNISEVLYILNYINSVIIGTNLVVVGGDTIRQQEFLKFTGEISEEALNFLFYPSFAILDEFYPHILQVILGNFSAKDQIKMIQAQKSNRLN